MSLAATRLDEYRLAYDRSNLDAWEHRASHYGAFNAFLDDTPRTIPGYQELIANRVAQVRTVSIPVLQRTTFSAGSSRTCSAQTASLTSAYVTPSWTTWSTGFDMQPALNANNYISYQDEFNKKLRHLELQLLGDLDTAAVTHLNTNKSAVNAADGNPYDVVANDMVVPAADNQLFLNEMGAIMFSNDYPDMGLQVVASPRFQALVREYSSQGTSNAENRAFQFGGYTFGYSNRVTIVTADRDAAYIFPQGTLAFLSWVDWDSQMGNKSTDGKEWMTMTLPLSGIEVGVLYQSTCADKSTTATGLNATLSESWNFSFDYSFNSAYNSDTATYAGPIYKARFTKV
jgi:hypothetical protein